MKQYLIKAFKNKYIIDIRDYNRIIKYFNIKEAILNSTFTVLSSPGYKEWLPKSNKYVINHNTTLDSKEKFSGIDVNIKNKNKININYIGSIRNYDININFIHSLKDTDRIRLNYHGEGFINKDIETYLSNNCIKNVILTGRYQKNEESMLYLNSDLINILIPNDSINSKTLLPNRLYNAIIFGKPSIALEGTYLSEIIKEYNFGIVIESFNNIEEVIIEYINNFDSNHFEIGRNLFFDTILNENIEFLNRVEGFLI